MPVGYMAGVVEGHQLYHFAKCEAWNATAVCGKSLRSESLIEGFYINVPKICPKCKKLTRDLPKHEEL
jgi:hypothetical protein